jgi:rod shape-determining protein MreD
MITSVGAASAGRNLTAAMVIVAALVVQVAVADRLPLPGSVTPDLVLLTVVALAMLNGELVGAIIGFCAGLAADIIPPADHEIGRYALVYCLIGYICGLVSEEMDRSPVAPFLAVAVGGLAGMLLYAGLGMMVGDPRATWANISRLVPLSVLYDVLASPFVVWAVLRVAHRFEGGRASRPGRNDLPPLKYRAMSREQV